MAQIRDTCFRVMRIHEIDIDLLDMHIGYPVMVETDHGSYNDELRQQIDSLEEGYGIHALVQSEDILQIDGIWRFLDFSIHDRTLISFQDGIDIVDDSPDELQYEVASRGGSSRTFELTDEPGVYVHMFVNPETEGDWRHLRYFDAHIHLHQEFPIDTETPYEVIHQHDSNHNLIRSYFISEPGTAFAETILSS